MKAAFLTRTWARDPMTGQPAIQAVPFYRQWLPMNCLTGKHAMGMPAWTSATGFGIVNDEKTARFGFDVVSMKLLMERWIPHQIKVAQALGQRVINDVDDLYDDIHEGNMAKNATDPEKNRVRNRDHYREAILQSDTITVSTPILKTHYEEMGHPDVRLVRNGINPLQFKFQEPVYRKRPVIGWVGAVDWRSGDLEALKSWLPGFLKEHRLTFHHSGHVPGHKPLGAVLGLPDDTYTWSAMVPFTRLHTLYQFDIGLVPLTPIPFNEAKSALKGLEYAASGIAYVASSSSEYRLLAEDGCGRTASSDTEWLAQLGRLLDFGARRDDVRRNFTTMMDKHTIVQRRDEWRAVFNG